MCSTFHFFYCCWSLLLFGQPFESAQIFICRLQAIYVWFCFLFVSISPHFSVRSLKFVNQIKTDVQSPHQQCKCRTKLDKYCETIRQLDRWVKDNVLLAGTFYIDFMSINVACSKQSYIGWTHFSIFLSKNNEKWFNCRVSKEFRWSLFQYFWKCIKKNSGAKPEGQDRKQMLDGIFTESA